MTAVRFVLYITEYWREPTNKALKDALIGHVKDFSETYLDGLLAVLLATYSREYPACPGVAELKKCSEAAFEHRESKRLPDLTRKALTAAPEDDTMVEADLHALVERLAKGKSVKCPM